MNHAAIVQAAIDCAAGKPLSLEQRQELAYAAFLGMLTDRVAQRPTALQPELNRLRQNAAHIAKGLTYA